MLRQGSGIRTIARHANSFKRGATVDTPMISSSIVYAVCNMQRYAGNAEAAESRE
jgi:hypothetical protein